MFFRTTVLALIAVLLAPSAQNASARPANGTEERKVERRKRRSKRYRIRRKVRRRRRKPSATAPWKADGWHLVALRHSKRKRRSVSRWLAPDEVAHTLVPRGGSVVMDIHVSSTRKRRKRRYHARVVWRGYERQGGTGRELFHTWEPFKRKLGKRVPRQPKALLRFLYKKLIRDAQPPARRADRGVAQRQALFAGR